MFKFVLLPAILLRTCVYALLASIPHAVYAQPQTVGAIISVIARLVRFATPVVAILAFIVFFWGAGQFILGSNDEEKLKNGRVLMLWGVIALFVMVSIWGILELFFNDIIGGAGGSGLGIPLLPV